MSPASTAALCFGCQGVLPPAARFCPGCGVAVDPQVMMLEPVPLDGAKSDRLPADGVGRYSAAQTVVGGDHDRDRRLVIAVGTLAVLLVGWLLVRTPVTTLDGVSEALAPERSEAPAAGDTDTAGDPDEPPRAVEDVEFTPVTLGGGGPVLGEVTGLDLYVSSGARLGRIDLDTGESSVVAVEGQPVAVRDRDLLLLSNQQILATNLDDPEGTTRLVYDLPVNSSVDLPEVVLDDDRLIMSFESFERSEVRRTMTVLGLDSGDVATFGLPTPAFAQNGLLSVLGSGAFDYIGGEFINVFDGTVVSAGLDTVIGFRCSTPGDCDLLAIDRRTGELLDNVILPEIDDLLRVTNDPSYVRHIPGSERYLLVGAGAREGGRIHDLSTGELLPAGLFSGELVGGLTLAEDPQRVAVHQERFLAVGVDTTLRVFDVDTGAGWTLELDDVGENWSGQPQRLFFVPR